MSRPDLAARFDQIDRLLETIFSCESSLDSLLLVKGTDSEIPISVIPLPEKPSSTPVKKRSEVELAYDVSSRIKRERARRGWRQKDLAEATGIARPNIARLESGRRMPKISTLHKIGQALGIPVEELLE